GGQNGIRPRRTRRPGGRRAAPAARSLRRDRSGRSRGCDDAGGIPSDLLLRLCAARAGGLTGMPADECSVLRSEIRWAAAMSGVVGVMLAAILYAGLALHRNPP